MNRSYIVAAALALGIVAWVGGGVLLGSPEVTTGDTAQAPAAADLPMTVSVRTQVAKSVQQRIVAQGHAEPDRTVSVRAETSGQIAEIVADEGATVVAGDVIAKLKVNDREARLEHAKAKLREKEGTHKASLALREKGFQTERRSDETYSALQTARAELEAARIELEHTEIRAPFEGVVLASQIELGSYVAVNGVVATIVDNDPLVVSVAIPQRDISNIEVGRPASVDFATGERREGNIRYVAARADEDTRTFRVEIEIANPNGEIPSGISAEATIVTGSAMAHFVSPAALSLDEDGVIGVKTVDDDNRVAFHAATIIRSEANGVWIAGLGEQARIITVGQGFVRVGDEVRVAEDPAPQKPGAGSRAAVHLSEQEIGAPKGPQ